MDFFKTIDDVTGQVRKLFGGASTEALRDLSGLRDLPGEALDRAVWTAVFGESETVRDACRWLIRAAARARGIGLASINDLYFAMGRGEVAGFTVPAMNIRGMTYDVVRAAFRAAKAKDVGAFVFEIARSEVSYTGQRPAEYAAVVLAAALREGWAGPVFVQGDHFQVNAKKYGQDPGKEMQAVRDIILEGVRAGFYQIDVDSSTLVDLSKPTLDEQQKLNYQLCAELTAYVREVEPKGVTVSVGGEIGEVGGKNSTVEELEAFMDGYNRILAEHGAGLVGISKISVQTGTSHGGVPLPDGSIAEVDLDLDTLRKLSDVARARYGMSGAVQHGASTLPDNAFHEFVKCAASEVHLATAFQNMVYDHPAFPAALKEQVYAWLRENCGDERKAGQTDEQFYYKTRKKGFGGVKRGFWEIPAETRQEICKTLEDKFAFLYDQLSVSGTRETVARFVHLPALSTEVPEALRKVLA